MAIYRFPKTSAEIRWNQVFFFFGVEVESHLPNVVPLVFMFAVIILKGEVKRVSGQDLDHYSIHGYDHGLPFSYTL